MRRIVLVVVSLAALLATGCTAGVQKTMKPSELHPSLSAFDADDQNPFKKEGSKVEYMAVDMQNYDQFFKDAATLQASIVYAELTLKDISATLTELAKGQGIEVPAEGADWAAIAKQLAEKKDSFKPEELAKVKAFADRLKVLAELLATVPEKGQALITAGANFKNTAQADFSSNPTKVPGVLSGVASAVSNLQDAVTRAPNLISSITPLVEALAALAG